MDEEKKEGQGEQEEQSTGDKVQQAVQDAKKIANLGTALASQNYAKAAIEAVKLLKDKKFRKKLWKRLLISMLMPIVSIILVASIVYAIINGVGDLLSKAKDAIVDFFTIDPKEGEIVISDDKIDMIIEQIKSLGIDAEDLKLTGDKADEDDPDAEEKNKEALRKYIRKYYEASAVTENLDYYGKNNKAGDNAKVYGTIKVYKAKGDTVDDSGGKQLTYKPYEELLEMQEKDKDNIQKYFSVNESNGNLIIPKVTTIKNDSEKSSYITLSEINYKAVVSQYTTPLNFFIYLNVVSQNPEFVSNLATLVKTNSEIHITLMESTTETTETTDTTYTLKSKTMGSDNTYQINEDKENQKEDKTTTTTITSTANPYITYVKTWFCEQTINYEKTTKEPVTTTNTLNYSEAEPTELVGEGETVTWKENVVGSSTIKTTATEYVETVRSDVKETLGEKGDGEKSFIGSWDVKYKLPNTSHKEAAAGNIISGSDLLFELLNMDSGMQSLEQIMRYALYKYTGQDYGVTEFEDIASNFEIRELSTTGSNYIVNTVSAPKLAITDASILKDALEKVYSGQRKENLVSEAQNFIDMQKKYNVNAIFAVAVTVVESGGGTSWSAIDSSTYNWYSITGSYNGNTYKDPNSTNPRTWRVYPSFKEATFDFGDLIANSEYYFKAGKYSVEQIAPTYCNEDWGKAVISQMNEIFEAAGIELPAQGFVTGGITTDEEAKQLQSYIETELLHTIVHTTHAYGKSSPHQLGPYATWWTNPYNMLDPFQCTWWANGRASMYLEQYGTKYKKYPTQEGHGGQYYDKNVAGGWFNYGSTPRPNSIISWKSGIHGHVAYVEGVAADGIYISHAGSGVSWRGIQKIPLDGSYAGMYLNGYIYLDEPK